jgi:hypothetical protein
VRPLWLCLLVSFLFLFMMSWQSATYSLFFCVCVFCLASSQFRIPSSYPFTQLQHNSTACRKHIY